VNLGTTKVTTSQELSLFLNTIPFFFKLYNQLSHFPEDYLWVGHYQEGMQEEGMGRSKTGTKTGMGDSCTSTQDASASIGRYHCATKSK
jgi:hypothetical protein